MAHVSLQFGAALVVPFGARHRPLRGGPNRRLRALRATAAAAGRDGETRPCRKCRRRAASSSAPAPRRAPAESAEE